MIICAPRHAQGGATRTAANDDTGLVGGDLEDLLRRARRQHQWSRHALATLALSQPSPTRPNGPTHPSPPLERQS
jgi:hypothetical protein